MSSGPHVEARYVISVGRNAFTLDDAVAFNRSGGTMFEAHAVFRGSRNADFPATMCTDVFFFSSRVDGPKASGIGAGPEMPQWKRTAGRRGRARCFHAGSLAQEGWAVVYVLIVKFSDIDPEPTRFPWLPAHGLGSRSGTTTIDKAEYLWGQDELSLRRAHQSRRHLRPSRWWLLSPLHRTKGQHCQTTSKTIETKLGGLRSLPDDERAVVATKDLALRFTKLAQGTALRFSWRAASAISRQKATSDATRFRGHQETLAQASRETPAPAQNGQPAFSLHIQLAQLSRYEEHMKVSLTGSEHRRPRKSRRQ